MSLRYVILFHQHWNLYSLASRLYWQSTLVVSHLVASYSIKKVVRKRSAEVCKHETKIWTNTNNDCSKVVSLPSLLLHWIAMLTPAKPLDNRSVCDSNGSLFLSSPICLGNQINDRTFAVRSPESCQSASLPRWRLRWLCQLRSTEYR